MTTAIPSRLTVMSTIPWLRCVRTNASEWFSHSAWLFTSASLGTVRTTRNHTFAARTARSRIPRMLQRRYHARRAGASGEGSDAMEAAPSESSNSFPPEPFVVESDSAPSVGSAGFSRSCVAKAEPRNRLCGMTVAPRMPMAARPDECQ